MNREELHNIKNKLFIAKCGNDKAFRVIDKKPLNINCLKESLVLVDSSIEAAVEQIHLALTKKSIAKPLVEALCETIELCSDMPLKVHSQVRSASNIVLNVTALESVIINIFKNSLEAGAKSVYVNLTNNILQVFDDGGGLEDDLLKQIKNEEYITTKDSGSGTGIYSIVKYCKDNDWNVEIKNQEFAEDSGGLLYIIKFNELKN